MEYVAVRNGTKDGQHDLPELYRASVTQSHRRKKQVRAKAFYSRLLPLRRSVEISWHLGNIMARRVINNGLGAAKGCGIPETSCRQSLGVLSLRLKEISVTHNFHFHSHSLWPSIKQISIAVRDTRLLICKAVLREGRMSTTVIFPYSLVVPQHLSML